MMRLLVHNKGTDRALGNVYTWAEEFVKFDPPPLTDISLPLLNQSSLKQLEYKLHRKKKTGQLGWSC